MTGVRGKVLLVLRWLFALLFVAAGAAKLVGAPMMVQEFGLFAPFGVGQWFRLVTGLIEIAGAVMLVRAATAFYGAALLLCVCLGAFVAQAAVIHQDVVHTIVFAALLGWIAWSYRPVTARPAAAV